MTADPATRDGVAAPRRYWALIGLWIAMAMSVLDSSIANIALPAITRDLGANAAAATWVATSYQIAIVAVLLPVTMLGEKLGYQRVYAAGLGLFTVMSLACAFAPDLDALVAFRFLQGLGAAAMMGLNGALMRFTYPDTMLGRGLGYNALVISVAAASGPALAALLLSLGDWRWLFLINVPAGVLSLVLAFMALPRPTPTARLSDWQSAGLNILTMCSLFLAVSDLIHGVLAWRTLLMVLIGLAAGAWLLRHTAAKERPLVPLDLIRRPALRNAYAASLCAFAAQMCLLTSLPFILEGRWAMSLAVISLLIPPLPVGVALASPLAGRFARNSWSNLMSAAGLCLFAASLVLIASVASYPPLPLRIAMGMGLCGVGFGLFQTPNNHVMLRTAPLDRAGAAGGMLTLSRLGGQTIGVLIAAMSMRLDAPASVGPLYLAALLALCAAGFAYRRHVASDAPLF